MQDILDIKKSEYIDILTLANRAIWVKNNPSLGAVPC